MYTSHELYCYPLKLGATKEMIAAQGLGTVLRLARKLGPKCRQLVVIARRAITQELLHDVFGVPRAG